MVKNLSLRLTSSQFQPVLDEICDHFEGNCPEEYLSSLVSNVEEANKPLYATMQIMAKKRSFKAEARALSSSLASFKHCVYSYCYQGDAEVHESAEWIKALWKKRETTQFNHMKTNSRINYVSLLLDDLSTPEAQKHVQRLPQLMECIKALQKALEVLTAKKLEVDEANGNDVKPESLADLKRQAVAKVGTLMRYLEAMAEKDPATYGEHLRSVTEIISSLNATVRGGAKKKPADDPAEESKPVSPEEPDVADAQMKQADVPQGEQTPAMPEVPDGTDATPKLTVSA